MAEPAYSISIPSIEDDTLLDCRIYHPKNLHTVLREGQYNSHGIKGAILAHPYAPLGGCYDDSVVISVAETLLEQGFVVGTFNFRYANSYLDGSKALIVSSEAREIRKAEHH